MAVLTKRLGMSAKIYALDTFEGMPVTDKTFDVHSAGDFNDVNLDEIVAFKNSLNLDNLEFVKGLFQDTAFDILNNSPNVALAHIDCDIYSACAYSYDVVKPFVKSGGYYLFDDATEPSCLGATHAVEELLIQRDNLHCEQIYPQYVFRKG